LKIIFKIKLEYIFLLFYSNLI